MEGILLPFAVIASQWQADTLKPGAEAPWSTHSREDKSPWKGKSLQKDHISLILSGWSPSPTHCAVRLLSPHTITLFPQIQQVYLLINNSTAFHDLLQAGKWTLSIMLELFQPHSWQLWVHAALCYLLCPPWDTILQPSAPRMQDSLHLYNLQIYLNVFLPWGIATCLMKSANLPASQASLIRNLWYDKLLNNTIYFSWDIAREGYASLPAETSSIISETSGNIILAGCLSFNIKLTCIWAGPDFFSNLNSCEDILTFILWCN